MDFLKLSLALILAASAGPSPVAPGNLFQLHHPDDPKLNGSFRVDFNGDLTLPYDVRVKAAGEDPGALAAKVAHAYRAYFTANAALPTLKLARRDCYVDVQGLVVKPGRMLVQPTTSLDEVISRAGGLSPSTKPEFARIQAANGEESKVIRLAEYFNSGDASLVPKWQGSERIFFQREAGAVGSHSITMMGEVRTPGEVAFKTDADILYYLSHSGGPTPDSKLDGIIVTRNVGGEKKQFEMDTKEPKSWAPLQEGDIVIVPSDRPNNFERKLPLISALTSLLTAAAILIVGV